MKNIKHNLIYSYNVRTETQVIADLIKDLFKKENGRFSKIKDKNPWSNK